MAAPPERRLAAMRSSKRAEVTAFRRRANPHAAAVQEAVERLRRWAPVTRSSNACLKCTGLAIRWKAFRRIDSIRLGPPAPLRPNPKGRMLRESVASCWGLVTNQP